MNIKLKPVADQVIVITGASGGIGLTTARMAARRGAAIVAVGHADDALRQLVQELASQGHRAIHVEADVTSEDDMRHAAHVAVERFGRIDTWVNNADASMFGRSDELAPEDQRRVFDIGFWGVVNGSLAALPYLRARGGALVNLGLDGPEASAAMQGLYTASKHAVKGYTDALRAELATHRTPVSVTSVRRAAVAPEVVADAILFAAEHPKRDLYVGASSLQRYVMRTGSQTRSALRTPGVNTALMALGVFAAALWYGRRAAR